MYLFFSFFFSEESIHQPLPFKVGRNPSFFNFFLWRFYIKGKQRNKTIPVEHFLSDEKYHTTYDSDKNNQPESKNFMIKRW